MRSVKKKLNNKQKQRSRRKTVKKRTRKNTMQKRTRRVTMQKKPRKNTMKKRVGGAGGDDESLSELINSISPRQLEALEKIKKDLGSGLISKLARFVHLVTPEIGEEYVITKKRIIEFENKEIILNVGDTVKVTSYDKDKITVIITKGDNKEESVDMKFRSEKRSDGSREYYIREINDKSITTTPPTNKNTPIEKIKELLSKAQGEYDVVHRANKEIWQEIQTATLNNKQVEHLWNGPFAKAQEALTSVSDAVDEVNKQLHIAESKARVTEGEGPEELKEAAASSAQEAVKVAVKAVALAEEAAKKANKEMRAVKVMVKNKGDIL